MIKLYPHQQQALDDLKDLNRCALYWDMGLGKTFGGSEKMMQLGAKVNLVICQKSKVDDWVEHFKKYYFTDCVIALDLTDKKQFEQFFTVDFRYGCPVIGVINYELAFRRPELAKLKDFTLMLDESSLIQNENSKRSRFILKKLKPKNVILLSGTPTGGKYERLWSQLNLLGWKISKKLFYNQYVDYHYEDNEGFPLMIIDGYKNEERLKKKMRQYGCNFLKTEEVFDLPEQIHNTIKVPTTKEYRKFRKDCIIITDGMELVGDTTLTRMLYERKLCGRCNEDKLKAFEDLLESTDDRLIVFYNFWDELIALEKIVCEYARPYSVVNGKGKDLWAYEECDNSITFIQYQAGAMGLNLQKANKIVYFTPPLSSELFEQSKKRIHRIGQEKPCFYYYLTCKSSIEEKIYRTLAMRKDYTDALFEKGE
jgi:SNF2 family DNA or RNA helicase